MKLPRFAQAVLLASSLSTGSAKAGTSPGLESLDTLTPAILSERCVTGRTIDGLRALTNTFKADLRSAMTVTPDERMDYESDSAIEFKKKIRKINLTSLNARLTKIGRTDRQDGAAIGQSTSELEVLDREIATYTELLEEHLALNSAQTYDLYGFEPAEMQVRNRDLDTVFTKYAGKGIECGADVVRFVKEVNRFPGAGELDSALLSESISTAQTDVLPDTKGLSEEKDKSELTKVESIFVEHWGSTQSALKELEIMIKSATQQIKDRYISTK